MKFNKAAMFGLDARIALAIFGALSVISGAALYGAIQQSQAVATITMLNEIGKAWEVYYLDTGKNLPRLSSDSSVAEFYVYKTSSLVKNDGSKGWNGPYLPYNLRTAPFDDRIEGSRGGDIWINEKDYSIDWDGSISDGLCLSGKKCYITIRIWDSYNKYSDALMTVIDEQVDNSDGATKGKFRWNSNAFNLQYISIKNPND